MKKVIVYFLCILLGFIQTAYAADIYTDYDFSDEAQAEFDRLYLDPSIYNPVSDPLQIKQDRHVIKSNSNNVESEPLIFEFEPNQYVLPEIPSPESIKSVHQGHVITVPEGTILNAKLQSGVSSGSLDVNDQITAALYKNWEYQGNVIAPVGSIVYGTVTKVDAAGYAYGNGMLEISFNKVMTPEGVTYDISTKPIELKSENIRTKSMARDILIGAGVGLLAAVLGSAFSGDNWGRNMAIFGGIGAAGGALKGTMQRGIEANIQADMPLELILSKPVNAAVYQQL